MTTQPTRVLNLLLEAKFDLHTANTVTGPHLAAMVGSWAYHLEGKPLKLVIFEFSGQEQLDASLDLLEAWAKGNGQSISFSQNGPYLLTVIVDPNTLASDKGIEGTIDGLLEAFAGLVER